ncbi:MAG: VanZ family protein [Longimonas sp.]|uniref:VanZ family protein n=1 Tax=Longimonas sp. TaxID=2039626 RepID=UPI00335D1650
MTFSLTARRLRLLAALWTLGILIAVTVPASSVPDTPPDIGVDKIVHVVMFAGFGGLWMCVLGAGSDPEEAWPLWRCLLVVAGTGLVLAVGTEWMQHAFLPTRDGNIYDVIANMVGLATGIGWGVWRVRGRAHAAAS